MSEPVPALLSACQAGEAVALSRTPAPLVSDRATLVEQAREIGIRVERFPPSAVLGPWFRPVSRPTASRFRLRCPPRRVPGTSGSTPSAPGPDPVVVLEAPHRIRATLAELLSTVGDRRVAIARSHQGPQEVGPSLTRRSTRCTHRVGVHDLCPRATSRCPRIGRPPLGRVPLVTVRRPFSTRAVAALPALPPPAARGMPHSSESC